MPSQCFVFSGSPPCRDGTEGFLFDIPHRKKWPKIALISIKNCKMINPSSEQRKSATDKKRPQRKENTPISQIVNTITPREIHVHRVRFYHFAY